MINSETALKQLHEIENNISGEVRLAASGWDKEWKVLFSTMLSAQTRDEKTIEVCEKLFKKLDSISKFAKASLKDIQKEIKSINYYKTKSKNLKNCALMIIEKFNGKIPKTIEELIELPGVGRKTANVFLSEARDEQAIGVDTHLSFVSQYMGWTDSKNPDRIEKDLKDLFPKKYWGRINHIVVSFGRMHSKKQQKVFLDRIK